MSYPTFVPHGSHVLCCSLIQDFGAVAFPGGRQAYMVDGYCFAHLLSHVDDKTPEDRVEGWLDQGQRGIAFARIMVQMSIEAKVMAPYLRGSPSMRHVTAPHSCDVLDHHPDLDLALIEVEGQQMIWYKGNACVSSTSDHHSLASVVARMIKIPLAQSEPFMTRWLAQAQTVVLP